MRINIFDQQKDLVIKRSQVKNVVKQVLALEHQKCDEIAIHFVNTQAITDLHGQFFNDPTPTDCISFPMDEEDDGDFRFLGEVFVCPQTAINYAKENNTESYSETTLYLVHGLLHLLGYDDYDEEEIKMRAAEKRHMDSLQQHGLLLKPD